MTDAEQPQMAPLTQISVLVATRGRPVFLGRLLRSLEERVSCPAKVDIAIYVDEDDAATLEFSQAHEAVLSTYFHVGPRTPTMGEMIHQLQRQRPLSDIYVTTVDDTLFLTPAWDDSIREAYASVPDGIAMAYVDDLTGDSGSVSLVTLSRAWIEASGVMFTEFFPFWFDDTWLDQVALMVGRKLPLPVVAATQSQGLQNRTSRMRNLAFWDRFFYHTLEDREQAARRLIERIYRGQPEALEKQIESMQRFCQKFRRRGSRLDRACVHYIEMTRATSARFEPPNPRYCAVEERAVLHLAEKARRWKQRGQESRARELLQGISYAAQNYQGLPEEVSVAGLNANPYPPLSAWEKFRFICLPFTLRLKRVALVLEDHPLHQWPSQLFEVFRRFYLRRRGRT